MSGFETGGTPLFDEHIHTADALGAQLEALTEANEHCRIAGSLGRAAFFEQTGRPFEWEYIRRRQTIVSKENSGRVVPRDIDVIGVTALASETRPFPVDMQAYASPQGSIVEQGDEWWLVAEQHNFAEPISADLMEPYEARLAEHEYAALQPVAQLAVLSILGNFRYNKIRKTHRLMQTILAEEGLLPPRTEFAAFDRLRALNTDSPALRARYFYRDRVPLPARRKLTVISNQVSKLID